MKSPRFKRIWFLLAIILLVTAGIELWLAARRSRTSAPSAAISRDNAKTDPIVAKASQIPANQPVPPGRPFPVVRETATLQWTAEDGKDTNVIRRLAHNDLEYQRMVGENSRIIRRQLVYQKDTPDVLIERAKLSGERIQQITLPGLDGQEVVFEITKSDLNPSGQQGSFAGHVAGRADSMVTLAFKGGREAFTVISPSDGLYLQGDPYEPGEVVVKSIDPDTYVQGVCGNP